MRSLSLLKSIAFATSVCLSGSNVFAGAQPILWSALRPAHQSNQAALAFSGKTVSRSLGETLAWREERPVQLTGFILPIDREGDLIYAFMLVPWAGACSHTAAPPPNQLVHVVPEIPFRISKIYETVTVTGPLRPGLEKVQLFIMDGVRVLDYGYSMGRAGVAKAADTTDPELRSVSPLGIRPRGL